MPFAIKIERDEDIKALNLEQVAQAAKERGEQLAQIMNEAGDTLDPSNVKVIEVKDGAELAQQWRARNEELSKLEDRRRELEEAEGAKKRADSAVNWANTPTRDPRPFAPGNGDGGHREPIKNLGDLVTEREEYREWAERGAPKGTGLNFAFEDARPSDLLALSASFRTVRNTLFETTAGWAPESIRQPGFVEAVTRPVQLIDIIPMGETGQEKIVYMEETTRTHAAAETSEGSAYNESTFALTEKESSVRKITDSIPVTDEQLEDVPQVNGYLNGRLLFGLRQRLDSQLLIGNGTPPNLLGLKNVSGIQTQAKGVDAVPDAVFKAMTKVRLTGRAMPTHTILHPNDWQDIRLLTTTDGAYLWGPPSEAGPERMWGLPIVQQDADSAGTGYVGSFQPAWISLFERRGVDVQVGYVGDQFKEGKRTIRADTRFAFVVFRPAAFCTVTGI